LATEEPVVALKEKKGVVMQGKNTRKCKQGRNSKCNVRERTNVKKPTNNNY